MHTEQDQKMMQACIELAKLGSGRTSPNPLVGSVVVDKSGEIVGRGYHSAYGKPHAEVHALDQADSRSVGGTLYVNLEPCCHFGKTPPCCDRVIASGVARVVIGMVDPNPQVSGGGIEKLREHGVDVITGVLESECLWLNRGFVKRIKSGLPWVCLKLATTLDGKIADRHGISRWISGAEARKHVHELRSVFDCVLIGGSTALIDDPELTVREIENARNPMRAVVDTRLRVTADLRFCKTTDLAKTIIFCSQEAFASREKQFPDHVKVVPLPTWSDKLDLKQVLCKLAEEGVLLALCEGGSQLAGALLQADLVDEVEWIIAPKILLDQEAIFSVSSSKAVLLSGAIQLSHVSMKQLGADMLVHGVINGHDD